MPTYEVELRLKLEVDTDAEYVSINPAILAEVLPQQIFQRLNLSAHRDVIHVAGGASIVTECSQVMGREILRGEPEES